MNGCFKTDAWADGDGGLEIHPATALTIVEMVDVRGNPDRDGKRNQGTTGSGKGAEWTKTMGTLTLIRAREQEYTHARAWHRKIWTQCRME